MAGGFVFVLCLGTRTLEIFLFVCLFVCLLRVIFVCFVQKKKKREKINQKRRTEDKKSFLLRFCIFTIARFTSPTT